MDSEGSKVFYEIVRPLQMFASLWMIRANIERGEALEDEFDKTLTNYDKYLRDHCGDDVAQYVIEQSMDIINLRKFGNKR